MALAFGDFVFDHERRELRRGDTVLKVDPLQLDLLACFLANSGRLLSKQELLDQVWEGRAVADNVLSVTVAKLRKVLGHNPGEREFIENRYGRGYRFLPQVSLVETPAPRSSQPPPATPASERLTNPPLVGRMESMQRLEAALARALAGKGSLCVLIGEPGIGKTRLAESLESTARSQGANPVWGRYQPMENAPPLWPFIQALRELNTEGLANDILRYLEARTVEYEQRLAATESTAAITREYAVEGSSHSHRTVDETSQALIRLSKHRPIVLLLDDLQWADVMSMRLLNYLVDDIARWPLLVVATLRSEGLAEESRNRDLSRLLRHRNCERIELARLHESDIREYVTAVFGGSRAEVSQIVFTRSEGNPFFMVELLRPWIDGPTPEARELTLSGYALDIVRQALRRLDARAREVLSAAAVIGRSFDLGLLSTVTERAAEGLIEILEDAMTSHVIVAARENHTHFVFGHDLIRHVLYEELPSIARVRLHQRVADALEARDSVVSPAEIAHHVLSALPSGDVARAVTAAQRAAAAASRIGAFGDSCMFLRRALEALRLRPQTDPALTCKLIYDLARCERAAGEPGFAGHFNDAVQLALKHGFADVLVSAGERMSGSPGAVAMPGVRAVLEAALEALPKTDHRRRAIVLAHLAWTQPHCQDAAKVAQLLGEAEKLAENSTDSAKRTVLRAKLYFAGGPDDHERALGIVTEMEHMASLRDTKNKALWMLEPQLARTVVLLQRGEFAQAQRAIDQFGASARELHHAELIWHYERICVVLRMNTGEFDFARRRLAQLKVEADRLQLHARRAVEAIDWGELVRQTSDIAPFAAQFARGVQADASDNPNVQAAKLRGMVQLGMLDEARAGLLALPARELSSLPRNRDYLATLANFAQASVATKGLAHAEVLYDLLKPYPQLCVAALSCHCVGVVSHFLATLARVLGDHDRARAHFEDALADQERLGLHPQLARSRFEFASMLIESGDRRQREEGRALCEVVQASAAKLGMQPLATAAARLHASAT